MGVRSFRNYGWCNRMGSGAGPRPNNAINADSKKQRSLVALLFAAGYGEQLCVIPTDSVTE